MEDYANEADEDLARERFKAQLLRAGLTSMSISLPASDATSYQSHASTSSHQSSSSTYTPDLLTPIPHSASNSYRFTFPSSTFVPSNRPPRSSPRRPAHNESDQDDDNDESSTPGPRTRRAHLRSNFLDARRMSLDHRKERTVDDEGSGIDDTSDSEDSENRSRRPSIDTQGSPVNGALLTFRNPFSSADPRPDPDLLLTASNSPSVPPFPPHSPPRRPSYTRPHSEENVHHPASGPSTIGSSTITARQPPPSGPRRPSLSPWLADEDGMPAINMFTAKVNTSPPRSLSDSAVPRRASLADEVGAQLPEVGSGSASVSGHEEMEWDMDFVLGGGGQGMGVDFQTLSEGAHPGSTQDPFVYPSIHLGSPSSASTPNARQAEEMGIDCEC